METQTAARWSDERSRWLYPCGHVAVSRSGKPIRRDGTPAAACRACEAIARKAEREAAEAERIAALARKGLVEHATWCRSCSEPLAVTLPVGEALGRPECAGCIERREWTAWLPEAKARVQAELRRRGWRCVRRARKSSGSSYYEHAGQSERIRLSDHELPMTPERTYNHEQGWRCADIEIVLDRRRDVADVLADIADLLDEEVEV